MNNRISRNHLLMEIAQLYSKRATCERLQVGAVIAKDGRIIVTGYNGVAKGESHCNNIDCKLDQSCTRAIHAEQNAIFFAAKQGISLEGSTLYCTHSPCLNCAKAIIQSGIREVFYVNLYRSDEGILLLNNLGIIVNQFVITG